MKFQKLSYLFIILMVFAACKNETSNTPKVIEVNTTETSDLDVSVRSDVTFKDTSVSTAFGLYNDLRAALVNTNPANAAKYADLLNGSKSMQEADAETKKALQLIIDGKDVNEQRTHFVTVTKAIEKLVDGNVASGAIYKQYCPMAFGNTGAYWLSDSKEIRNPYFGDKMLKCGRVDAEIK